MSQKGKIDKTKFFDGYRNRFGKIPQTLVKSLDLFIDETNKNTGYFTLEQWAYVFATVYHETRATFEPVREAFWLENAEQWRKKNLRYYPFYGRGLAQITWEDNYRKYSKKLGVDLIKNPDLALEFKNAFFITIDGMKTGAFTGKKIGDYVNSNKKDYENARRVINGKDKAELISGLALSFEIILENSIMK